MEKSTLPYGLHIDEMKNRIISISLQAFREQGIRNITMDDIAHRLSMSKRTLYQLFEDKEALLLESVKLFIKEEGERLAALYEKKPNVLNLLLATFEIKMQKMNNVSSSFMEDIVKYPRVTAFIEKHNKERETEAVNFLNRGIEEGIFRQGVNFHIVYAQLMQGFEMLIASGLSSLYSYREIFVNTVVPYIRGCATIEGIQTIDNFMENLHKNLDKE